MLAVELAIIKEGYDLSQKRVWREITAAALRGPAERRQDYLAIQNRRVQEALESLQARGKVKRSVDCAVAARAIYAVGRNAFRTYIMNDILDIAALEAQIRADVTAAFLGMMA